MSRVKTDMTVNSKKLEYEIFVDGYEIYLGSAARPWVKQREPYIPYPELGYEGSCLKQIEEITKKQESEVSLLERVETLEEEKKRMQAVIDALAAGAQA